MENLRGSLLMVLAMAAFTIEDALIKLATQKLPVGEVLILFGAGGMLVFAALSMTAKQPIVSKAMLSRTMLWRSASELMGRLCYTLAIALTPLSSASAILQATPLVVALGAVVFFNEQVGWRRWVAILVGFIGVLLILRPGLDGFEAASIFAILGTIGFAGRDLATRAAPPAMSNTQLGVLGFFVLVVAGCVALIKGGSLIMPDRHTLMILAGAVVFGVLAYNALTGAMRQGDISVVAPFRYTRLVFAMLMGAVVFAERPDALTLLGGSIIVASGLYTVVRERRHRKR